MRLETQIEKLLIYDPDQSRSTVHVFVAHPTPVEEQTLGRLVMLIEIEPRQPSDQDFIHALQHDLAQAFYGSDALHPEAAFESTLHTINQRIADLVADYAYNWHEHLNVVIGVIHADQLIFADYGNIHIFLFHDTRVTDILASAEGTGQTGRAPVPGHGSPLKVFSNIATGKLRPGENVLFTTTALMDYFSQEKLRRLITERPPKEALAALESILAENINNTAFATVLLSAREPQTAQTFRSEPLPVTASVGAVTAPQASMDRLIQREQRMQEFLTPSLAGNIRKSLGSAIGSSIRSLKLRLTRRPQARRGVLAEELHDYAAPYGAKTERERSSLTIITVKLFSALWRGLTVLVLWGREVIIHKQKPAIDAHALAGRISSLPSRLIIYFKRLTPRGKILLGAAAIIIFAFAQGVVSTGFRQTAEGNDQKYEGTVSTIEGLILEADLALSYDNTTGAREKITQAQNAITELPQRTTAQKERARLLTDKLSPIREQANGITRIDHPTVAADFGVFGDVSVAGMALVNDVLYTFSPADNSIYALERDATAPEVFAKASSAPTFQYVVSPSANTLTFFTTKNGITEFTIQGKGLRDLPLTLSAEGPNIVDIGQYQGRLYFLDIANNQVWKATRGAQGYGTTQAWIQDSSASVRGGRSLAIDGSIYILTDTGTILKFTRGSQEQFALDAIEPSLTSGTKLWTDTESDKLYILDANGKRLVVFTKEGRLVHQYISDGFDSLRGLAIDEKNKTAYLLNGAKVFSLPLQ